MTKHISARLVLTAYCMFSALGSHAQSAASCTFHTFQIPASNGVAIANDINKFGTIVGFVNLFTGHTEGFTRFNNGQTNFFTAPNATETLIARRNNSGVNVGSFTPKGSTISNGFVTHGTSFQSVSFPPHLPTFLRGINSFGTIVGTYLGTDNHFDAIKLQNGKFTILRPPGAVDAFANGINDQGVIVGVYFTGGVDSHGFVLQNGTIHTLDFPHEVGFGGTTLNDISNTGEIVGFVWTGPDTRAAFIFSNGVFKTITVPNARLTEALGINSLNVIVGHAIVVDPKTGNETDVAYTATCK